MIAMIAMIEVPDLIAAAAGIEYEVSHARCRVRDEANRTTWVYDRLFGLDPDRLRRLSARQMTEGPEHAGNQ